MTDGQSECCEWNGPHDPKPRRIKSRKKRFPDVKENEVVRAVLRAVDWPSDGILLWRHNVAAFNVRTKGYKDRFVQCGQPGQSDINGIVRHVICPVCKRAYRAGVRIEIECKATKGTLSDHQKRWIGSIREANGIAFVVRPEPSDEDPTGLNHRLLRRRMFTEIHKTCPECVKTNEKHC